MRPTLRLHCFSAAVGLGLAFSAVATPLHAQTIANGNFNTAGAGDPDYFDSWLEYIAPVGPADCQVNGNSRVKSNTDGVGDLSLIIRAQPPAGCVSGVSQVITGLTIGNSYSFNFFARYIPPTDAATNNLSIIFGGTTLFSQELIAGATFDPYASGSFIATSTSALLQIEGFTSLSAGQVLVDDISINSAGGAVVAPEPTSVALIAFGLVGLSLSRRRRQA